MSGHAAANTLLGFARMSGGDRIELVHGSMTAGETLREHLVSNTDATVQLAEIGSEISLETGSFGEHSSDSPSTDEGEATFAELRERQQQLQRELDLLGEQIERYVRTEGGTE